jgi:ribonuclease D
MKNLITTNDALSTCCYLLKTSPLLFIDTEFLRERTYYAQLCLVQVAGVAGEAYAIDVLAKGLDLSPLLALLADTNILKIFHSGRQDLEIFVTMTGAVPTPIFDTQIAAMILGLGEQIGYNNLIDHFLKQHVSKVQQFTDWSKRPLSDAQLEYALDDVRLLREAYPKILSALDAAGRTEWVAEESAHLLDISLYSTNPQEAWLKIKKKDTRPRFLARLQAVAAWREETAIAINKPRTMIVRDDCLHYLALANPATRMEVEQARGAPRKAEWVSGLFAALQHANALSLEDCPHVDKGKALSSEKEVLRDVLKLVQKMKADEHNLTPRLLSSSEDLLLLIEGDANAPALHGWRYELFGRDALALLNGEKGLRIKGTTLALD